MKNIKNIPRYTLMGLVQVYIYCISPYFRGSCRFQPTCSAYAHQALQEYGAVKGMILILKRIGKCHPFGPYGIDPVPEKRG